MTVEEQMVKLYLRPGRSLLSEDGAKTTLILPSLSIANVGQLAVDLVLTNNAVMTDAASRSHLLGYMSHPALLPFYGPDPNPGLFAGDDIGDNVKNRSMAVELYRVGTEFTIIQQRAIPVAFRAKEWSESLWKWILDNKDCFKSVIVLAGADARLRNDRQIRQDNRVYCVGTENDSNMAGKFLVPLLQTPVYDYELGADTNVQQIQYQLPSAGLLVQNILKQYINSRNDALPFPVSILSVFCIEGDNMNDAMLLTSGLMEFIARSDHLSMKLRDLKLDSSSTAADIAFKLPVSWSHLYGPPPPSDIPLY